MRMEQLVFRWFLATLHAHAAIINWVWLQVNFEGAIFAGRKKSAKTSKFKHLENKSLYGIQNNAPQYGFCV